MDDTNAARNTGNAQEPTQSAGCGGVILDSSTQPGPIRLATTAESTDGVERWVVTRYEDAVAALSDPRLSSERAYSTAGAGDQTHEGDMLKHTMIAADPPDHTRLRKLVVRAFSAKRVEALRPRVQRIADELLDAVAAPREDPMDIVETFAFPLPVRVISEILGVPDDVRDRLLGSGGGPGQPITIVPADATRAVMAELIDARRIRPADDLLSTLVAAHEQERLSDAELVNTAGLLFAAGHATTVNLIAGGVLTLLRHPEQLAELRSDPTLISSVVDELLRHVPPVPAVSRYALDDVEIGGVTIPRGSHVDVALVTANHDPHKFADPEDFDIHRVGGEDVAFGHGIHFCLGARLAKLEGEVAIGTLLRRFPDLTLADASGTGDTIGLGEGRPVWVYVNGTPAVAAAKERNA